MARGPIAQIGSGRRIGRYGRAKHLGEKQGTRCGVGGNPSQPQCKQEDIRARKSVNGLRLSRGVIPVRGCRARNPVPVPRVAVKAGEAKTVASTGSVNSWFSVLVVPGRGE